MEEFIHQISKSLEANTFVKITLSSPMHKDAEVRNIYAKQVEIKGERKLSFTYRYQKRDIVKNYAIDEALANLRKHIGEEYRFATLFTVSGDFILQHNGNHFKMKQQEASITELPSLSHDRSKNRKLEASDGKKYLHLLGITDANGNVNPKSQDKFKQITHYIEILSSHIDTLPTDRTITVADMGSGKGYLTFALYDYLANTLKCKADVTGVEIRHDMVELCNKFAKESGFDGLHFAESAIDSYNADKLDTPCLQYCYRRCFSKRRLCRSTGNCRSTVLSAPDSQRDGKRNTKRDFVADTAPWHFYGTPGRTRNRQHQGAFPAVFWLQDKGCRVHIRCTHPQECDDNRNKINHFG